LTSLTFKAIRAAHLERILSDFKDTKGKPLVPGVQYLFPFTSAGSTIFGLTNAEGQPTGRQMCIVVLGVRPIADCSALNDAQCAFPFPPEIKRLGPGWWSISIYCDDTVPDELFGKRVVSAVQLLEQKAEQYMQTSGFDYDWRVEKDGVIWRVAKAEDLDAILEVHRKAHPHINGAVHPHPFKPPVVLTLVAEKDGKIISCCYFASVAEACVIGSNPEAFASLPAMKDDVMHFLKHRAFLTLQTRVVPEGAKAMRPMHDEIGFADDGMLTLRQKV